MAVGELGEGFVEVDSVFGRGGEVAADGAELRGSGECAQPETLCLSLIILFSRSAAFLSNGAAGSVVKRR